MIVQLTLLNGDILSSETYNITVCYQYGQKATERNSKPIAAFVQSPFYIDWFAQATTCYLLTKDKVTIAINGQQLWSLEIIE